MGGDPEALASLLDIEPRLRERYESELKQQEASQLLLDLRRKEESLRSISDRASIPLDRVVRLLDETDYRLIRSDDDLLEALVEMITKIGTEAAYDLSMLYGKPEPEEKQGEKATGGIKSKVKKAKKKANVRRRLDEDALQAYVHRRLNDMHPARIPGVEIEVIREPQVKYQRRFDLKVSAPTLDRELVTVIIEIKWSDNPETEASLVDQLAREYLLEHGKTHGIHLIGWMGEWRKGGKLSHDLQELKKHLGAQVESLKASEEGRSLRIEPCVLDLRLRNDLPDRPPTSPA